MNVKALIKRAKQEGATEHHRAKAPAEPASEEPLVLPASIRTVNEESLIDGLQHVHLLEDWLPLEAEAVLLRNLQARSQDFLQLRGKRTARYGGDPGPPFVPEPLPPWLLQLCSQVAATLAADSDASAAEALPPNHVLVNHYRPGEGIMPHTDGPAYEPRAAILSLGSAVVFSFWRDHAHAAGGRPPALSLLLPPRSLLVFSGEAYSAHLHGIAEQRFDELHPGLANWTASVPVQVLQNGVKMTNEPPSGLRANLLRTYSALTDKMFEESNKPRIFRTLLFGFCFFHAVVQDRRKFGPIGWNIAYGFTPEDLQVCRQQLMIFVNQYEDVPYKVLNFLGAKINYGGRVTDDKDKLLISTILQTYICQEAIDNGEGYKYSTSGLYYVPEAETVQDFVTYIRQLPLYPMPEAFGLHENCNITCAQDEALKLLTGMQSMVSLGGGGGSGQSAEEVMDNTAASVQDRLPTPFPLDICEQKFPTRYEESMNTVVKQECLRYNKLLWCMSSSLKDFRKAIKGLIVMTFELECVGKSMFVNEVPKLWDDKAPPSLKPLSSWYLDILERVRFFQMWYDLGRAPPVFWISGIFFPQAFFTGAMQNFARRYNEEIDLLSYRQSTMDDITDAPKQLTKAPDDGVYIYGIFLEGCRWDVATHQLEDSRKKELFTSLPPFWFCPIKNRVPDELDYRCPCYKITSRKGTLLTTGHSTNFVLYIELKTDKVVDKWIKAGVAAFLALKF